MMKSNSDQVAQVKLLLIQDFGKMQYFNLTYVCSNLFNEL
jgi:hypothetical protein